MPENWEKLWIDYYQLLQVHPSAELEFIKSNYRKLAQRYHPDTNKDPSAAVAMKKLNDAMEILGDPERRKTYDTAWIKKTSVNSTLPKPKPLVEPSYIYFKNVEPRKPQTASFIVRNTGGPYAKINVWISNPNSWVKISGYSSLSDADDELPLRVEIEAEGDDWNKFYLETIRIKLDEEEIQVRVELRTKLAPVHDQATAGGETRSQASHTFTPPQTPPLYTSPPQTPPTITYKSSFLTWRKWIIGFVIVCSIALLIGFFQSLHASSENPISSFEANLPEREPRRNPPPAFIQDGDWFPDGSKIVLSEQVATTFGFFGNDKRTGYRIFVMNTDGTNKIEVHPKDSSGAYLGDIDADDFVAPLISPDGKKIAFVVVRNDHPARLWVMNANGSNARWTDPGTYAFSGGLYASIAFTWLTDDLIVFWKDYWYEYKGSNDYLISLFHSNIDSAGIYTVNINSGEIIQLKNPPNELLRGKFVSESMSFSTIRDFLK